MSITDSCADVPLPTGAEWDGEWQDDEPPHQAYRIVHGRGRSVGPVVHHFNGLTTGLAEVETSACQYRDGALDTGSDGPRVQVHVYSDSGMSSAHAREVAALLLEAADEVDGWAAQ